MKKMTSILSLFLFASVVLAGDIPAVTGIVAKDGDGKTWDFDALLNQGKVIWVHQAFSG